ncbi:hypothetical protein QQF64_034040 [Cirrhinus molitorella]
MEEWKAIAEDFQKLWSFPNCVGTIDGKHVTIQAPANSGSQFHNYKVSFSIVLLAVVDARYRFRMIDVGAYGKSSDGGTLSSSTFGQALRHDALDLPPEAPLLKELKEPCPLFLWQTKHFLCSTALCTEPSSGMQCIIQVGSNNASREAGCEREVCHPFLLFCR